MAGWKLKTRHLQPIGLDIGYSSIKMLQLAINAGHTEVTAAEKVDISPQLNDEPQRRRQFIISAVRQMLSEGKFKSRDVVTCLPNDDLKMTSLRFSEGQTEQIEQALKVEVAQRFGLDTDRDVVDYLMAGTVRQGQDSKNELIIFASDEKTVKSHIAMLEDSGLKPVAIDVVPCALFRMFERSLRRRQDMEETMVFIDIGDRFTTVVFGRQGQINFAKQIPIGSEKFDREIAAKLGVNLSQARLLRSKLNNAHTDHSGERPTVTDRMENEPADSRFLDVSTRQVMIDAIAAIAEELTREISLCFKYYTVTFRGERVQRAIFAGGQVYEKILLGVLRRQLTVDIELAEPFRGFDITNVEFDGDRRGPLCEWAIAVGLGLKGWQAVLAGGTDNERN